MPKRTTSYKAWLDKRLADPKVATAYLNAALEDSLEMFLKALRKVVEARQIPVTKIADEAGFSRESFYRMTAEGGNPTHGNLSGILHALGLSFHVIAGPEPAGRIAGGGEHHGRSVPQMAAADVPAEPAAESGFVSGLGRGLTSIAVWSSPGAWTSPGILSTASTFYVPPLGNAGNNQVPLQSDNFRGNISWAGALDSITKNSNPRVNLYG